MCVKINYLWFSISQVNDVWATQLFFQRDVKRTTLWLLLSKKHISKAKREIENFLDDRDYFLKFEKEVKGLVQSSSCPYLQDIWVIDLTSFWLSLLNIKIFFPACSTPWGLPITIANINRIRYLWTSAAQFSCWMKLDKAVGFRCEHFLFL